MFKAAARMGSPLASCYDPENSWVNHSVIHQCKLIEEFLGKDPIEEGRISISNLTQYYGNEWWAELKKWLHDKIKNEKSILESTPFVNPKTGKLFQVATFTAGILDGITEFGSKTSQDSIDKNEIGDSANNTIHMKLGLEKVLLLRDLVYLTSKANHYMGVTAQLGKAIPMDPRAPPDKKLQYLKNNDKIKGATDKFAFNTNICYNAYNAAPLINAGTKGPEYPLKDVEYIDNDTDLNTVTLRVLRNKRGTAGQAITIVASQRDGILPSLTEFHYIKEKSRFGISGTLQHYNLDLCPDIKLQRTTVRSKLDEEPRLRRAVNITSEMLQIKEFWGNQYSDLMCTPQELYEDIVKLGYNWDDLLLTRGWWAPIGVFEQIPFLSTMDLLRMRKGLYKPYWLK